MTTAKRRFGDTGEELATRHLVRQGYHLLERGWRVGHLEVDIIAERFGEIVFVEVKTRRDEVFRTAREAVDHTKQRNLLAAAREYCLTKDLDQPVRFDIITVVGAAPPYRLEHIPDAFSATTYAHAEGRG
ncbi:MAG: YraN family protein [Bacteroidaceae bacterium]|nr:YraN family protein [Bacteroidaceae bacterium]